MNTMMPLILYNADTSANSIKWLKKSSCISFGHLWVANAMVPLMMPSVSCDANNGFIWPKKSCCTVFQSSWPNKQNGAIDNAISVLCCSHLCQQVHLTKSQVTPCLNCLQLIESGVIDDALSITWQQCQYQWHHMPEKVMFHLVLIIVTS